METIIQLFRSSIANWVYTLLRKVLTWGVPAAVLAWLVANGVITQEQLAALDGWLQAIAAFIVALLVALWSAVILPWIKAKLGAKG